MDLEAAKALTLRLTPAPCSEAVALEEALGRVLFETVSAPRDIPGESRSRWDGFTLRSRDSAGATPHQPVALTLTPGTLAAGHLWPEPLAEGSCLRILTGAPLPEGADAVVPQEDTATEGGRILLSRPLRSGQGVSPAGFEIPKGEAIAPAGAILTPSRLARLAALGAATASVARRPRVALLATGDELREIGQTSMGPTSFCNNRHLLGWLARLQGAIPVHLGIAPDDGAAIADRLRDTSADLVITTGGAGRGDRDYLRQAWRTLGAETVWDTLNLSPGKGSALARRGAQLLFGLPGSPGAARVVFELLITPVLRRMQGLPAEPLPIKARLTHPLRKRAGLFGIVQGRLDWRATPLSFTPDTDRESSGEAGFAYILLDPAVVEVAAGADVLVCLKELPLLASPLFDREG